MSKIIKVYKGSGNLKDFILIETIGKVPKLIEAIKLIWAALIGKTTLVDIIPLDEKQVKDLIKNLSDY